MTSGAPSVSPTSYLDIQGQLGITKHNGGMAATLDLFRRCRIADASEVLYVGSGIGVGPCTIVRHSGCQVVAVDISEKMLEWSRLRAKEAGVSSRIEFRLGDVLDLPLEPDRFDAVLVESVLAFVEDKERAIRECVRVTAPGGYVGMNETVWLQRPSDAKVMEQATGLGAYIPTSGDWERLWIASGLMDRTLDAQPIGMRDEVLSRIEWVGWRWTLRAWSRLVGLLVKHPQARDAIRAQFRAPAGVVKRMGVALASGRKPGGPASHS
jgi:SAM-dependent methyltransferase